MKLKTPSKTFPHGQPHGIDDYTSFEISLCGACVIQVLVIGINDFVLEQ